MLACLGEYIILPASGISVSFKTLEGKLLQPIIFVETLSQLAVLALVYVLLVLGWLHL